MLVRLALVTLLAGFVGCSQPPGGFDSPVPQERLKAIAEAAEHEDKESIPDLIRLLESDDPVVRMASIRALERITGQTLGYDHAGSEPERRRAARAWARWYAQTRDGPPRPGGEGQSPGTGNTGGVAEPISLPPG